jgi:hypothetical protein
MRDIELYHKPLWDYRRCDKSRQERYKKPQAILNPSFSGFFIERRRDGQQEVRDVGDPASDSTPAMGLSVTSFAALRFSRPQYPDILQAFKKQSRKDRVTSTT